MSDKQKTDLELVKAFKKGCIDSYEELIKRYSIKAYSLAQRLTRNPLDAEEVLQDVFITVFRKIHGFEGKSSFSSWLYRVTVNAAFMKLRKRKQDQSISLEDVLPQVLNGSIARAAVDLEGDRHTARKEVTQVLEDAISKLPDEYRPVFILRDVDGLTSREVAKILDLTIPAVKSRLHRSRLMLRKKLTRFYREYSNAQPKNGEKVANS